MSDKIKGYLKTKDFEVVDTIGVPHSFCIGPEHIEAAQDFGGSLGQDAIASLEAKHGPSCKVRGCNLMFPEHETALLIKCRIKDQHALGNYLQLIVKKCKEDGFAGFAFLDASNE